MNPAAEVAELAALIEGISGNVIPVGHYPFLEETARRRATARGLESVADYVRLLARGDLAGEWSALLPAVTIKESYFYRTPAQFTALTSVILPPLIERRAPSRRLSLWSAGCARGEEPGTLAIVLAGEARLAGWDWHILATDVDEVALEATRCGIYGDRAVAQVPPPALANFFTSRFEGWELRAAVRQRIDVRTFNLMGTRFQPPGVPFDIVFLRNVLIYFRPEVQRRVIAGIATTLAPDGVLFLGPAETLWQLSDAFSPEDLGDCFCYRLRRPGDRVTTRSSGTPPVVPPPGAPRSSSGTLPVVPPLGTPVPTEHARRGRGPARFTPPAICRLPPTDRAAARVPSLGSAPGGTPARPARGDERTRAIAMCLAASRLPKARAHLDDALRDDPGDPLVHALEGLYLDVSGHSAEALAAYRAALFLDPGLYQVRTLLAEALRHAGHTRRAEHEYQQVLACLARGPARDAAVLAGLPVPDRTQAEALARRALREGAESRGQR